MRERLLAGAIVLLTVSSAVAQDCASVEGRWPWGPATAVTTAGSLALFNSGAVLQVADVTNPAEPTVVGGVVLPEAARDVRVSGSVAFVAAGESGLRVIDISTPTVPTEVGSAPCPDTARDLGLFGSYVLVAAESGGLRVFDVSTPSAPVEVGSYPDPYAVSVAVDPYLNAYVLDSHGGMAALLVIDVIDPTDPVLLGTTSVGFYNAQDVVVAWPYVYGTDANLSGFVVVVDVTDLTDPQHVCAVACCGGTPTSIQLTGSHGYVACAMSEGSGLVVLDLSDPTLPDPVGFTGLAGSAARVAVAGGHAYTANSGGGLAVIDLSVPASPYQVAVMETPGHTDGIAAAAGLAVVADQDHGLRVLDVAAPSASFELGLCETPVEASRVVLADTLAFLADRISGLRVVDLSSPAQPTELGTYPMPYGARGLDAAGDHVFLVDVYNTLEVVDVSTPSAPAHAATLTLPGSYYARDVAVDGDLAVVLADPMTMLRVIDVSSPGAPFEVGSLALGGSAYRVLVEGARAYLNLYSSGLVVVDLSDPSKPTALGSSGTPTGNCSAHDLTLFQNHVLLVNRYQGLRVVNVANVLWPREVALIENARAVGIDVRDGLGYLSTGSSGVTILDVTDCTVEMFFGGFESGSTAAWPVTVR